jgi:hypothetical protein
MDYMDPKTDKAWDKEMNETRKGRTKPANLRDVPNRMPHLLPTPMSHDYKAARSLNGIQKRTTKELPDLLTLGLLPTPRAIQIPNSYDHIERGKIDSLMTMAKMGMLPTPQAQEGDKITGMENQDSMTKRVRLATGKSSQLNPQFVAEMMGFPVNWTELPFLSGETKV